MPEGSLVDDQKILRLLRRVDRFLQKKNVPEPAAEQMTGKMVPYDVLIMTILSLRTKDSVTIPASQRLFEKAPDLPSLSQMKISDIESLIFPVGFYRTKAKTIKTIAERVLTEFGGKIPDTLEGLLSLPGVGLKTANLVLTVGFEKEGFCVDIHVHRILNRWGVIQTHSPDETYHIVEPVLPRKWKRRANALLVAFGQHFCRPVSPFCSVCPLLPDCNRIEVDKHR
ncbi:MULTISPECIES: endonuclease III domain-containing protein [Leptospirillum]|uniref:Endonuclease III n=2 Tax=Leptospirillum ferriphilum TaxID=178606 RepID=A0A1V3SXV0_9BACT|nr:MULTISPECIES: endonuclease III [Leptospirillum]MCL5259054.1 endonuclease III [Nitrospirota bacterium]AFS53652.1 putative EndoIII-related endonuclease [Leptospirillum ferriphilum ML-04]AKS23390.1 endonuclease III [Leptospirillum sp. Group II 'CF-1']OOH74712.1 endonuclease III [Leptospirillum ferriphilum]OOH81771.1 endonuclease III [Leptospirillum ferriphilum]